MKPRSRRKKDKKKHEKIANERISMLFRMADKRALLNDIDLASTYVGHARKIAMRYNVRIPREYKRKFCKYCYCYLLSGANSKTRINSTEKRVETECLGCGRIMYFPYAREINEKRRNTEKYTKYGGEKLKNEIQQTDN